ncbi:MAG: hypothetical protein JSR83_20840 [Proteobacteria bacterium]|nr:hypothetical protein [Pseudomonadota bacterium]
MRAIVDRGGDPLEDRDRVKGMPTFSEFVRQEYPTISLSGFILACLALRWPLCSALSDFTLD